MELRTSLPITAQFNLPEGYAVLLNGQAGSGKTTFGLQFVNEGLEAGEKAIILTFDMNSRGILEAGKSLGFDFQRYMRNLIIIDHSSSLPQSLSEVSIALHKAVDDPPCKAKRILIDSLSTLALVVSSDDIPRWAGEQRARLRKSAAVSVFCYDDGVHPSLKRALQNVLDGTIELQVRESDDGTLQRYLRIFNLRGMSHSTQWCRFEIIPNKGVCFL